MTRVWIQSRSLDRFRFSHKKLSKLRLSIQDYWTSRENVRVWLRFSVFWGKAGKTSWFFFQSFHRKEAQKEDDSGFNCGGAAGAQHPYMCVHIYSYAHIPIYIHVLTYVSVLSVCVCEREGQLFLCSFVCCICSLSCCSFSPRTIYQHWSRYYLVVFMEECSLYDGSPSVVNGILTFCFRATTFDSRTVRAFRVTPAVQ